MKSATLKKMIRIVHETQSFLHDVSLKLPRDVVTSTRFCSWMVQELFKKKPFVDALRELCERVPNTTLFEIFILLLDGDIMTCELTCSQVKYLVPYALKKAYNHTENRVISNFYAFLTHPRVMQELSHPDMCDLLSNIHHILTSRGSQTIWLEFLGHETFVNGFIHHLPIFAENLDYNPFRAALKSEAFQRHASQRDGGVCITEVLRVGTHAAFLDLLHFAKYPWNASAGLRDEMLDVLRLMRKRCNCSKTNFFKIQALLNDERAQPQ